MLNRSVAIILAFVLPVASYAVVAAAPAAPQTPTGSVVLPEPARQSQKVNPKGEAEFLVAPGGGAFEVPIHAGTVLILTMPEPLDKGALASSTDFEIRSWSDVAIAVRANQGATTATLAVATQSGSVRLNLTFRVVPPTEEALALVRVKSATQEQVIEARVSTELEKRLAPKLAALAEREAQLDALVRERAEKVVAERILRRNGVVELKAHARNQAAAIAHVRRAFIVGETAYLMFQIENRSSASYRLASVRVMGPDKIDRAGGVTLSLGPSKDSRVIGAVPAGTTANGVVALRNFEAVKGKRLTMVLAEPGGGGAIALASGIEIE